ncbi:hypothetical protein [Helicobacter ibis]|uniref:Uncharacterized protein n=1 Tax=Helicobacter ibis TaxID=2962633 RepID=A0ABT4VDU0_9HELI|nr:hypothetical protein [Helicobacter ibis]MDA3968305.1 hypothetical protein [Helicobacter ibis]
MVLASKRYKYKLLQNLQKHGINSAVCGLNTIAKQYNEFLREKYKNKKIIAIYSDTEGRPHYKYLGSIREILQKHGFTIVYILSFENLDFEAIYKYHKDNSDEVIFANFEFLSQLDFFPFVISFNNILNFHPSVTSLRIHSSLDEVQNYVWLNEVYNNRETEKANTISMFLNTYLNIHSKSHLKYLSINQSLQNADSNPRSRFILGGYPSIDKEAKDILGYKDTKRDTIIFVSALISIFRKELSVEIIKFLLSLGYRVIFKSNPSHISHSTHEDMVASYFLDNEKFVYQKADKPKLSIEDKERSITAIECASSLMYSYPVTAKRPSILFYPPKNKIPSDLLENDAFYNPNIHIRVFECEYKEVLGGILESLANDEKIRKEWYEKIDNYCKNDLYNFGNASEEIAKWIIDWYNANSILDV